MNILKTSHIQTRLGFEMIKAEGSGLGAGTESPGDEGRQMTVTRTGASKGKVSVIWLKDKPGS